MKLSQLNARALREQRLAEEVGEWRLNDSWRSFTLYLYWRNRYPVLTELLSRLLLFAEIYLLYRFFHLQTAASFSLIHFCIFIFRALFQGVVQGFRVAIATEELRTNRNAAGRLFPALLAISTLYGLALPILLVCFAALFLDNPLATAFAAIWVIILPLQLRAGAWWMLVYTQHRLRRRFLVVTLCRVAPVAALLIFYSVIGPYAYLLGVLLGRAAENLYLIGIARDRLLEEGVVRSEDRASFKLLRRVIRIPDLIGHLLFPLPYQLYSLLVGLALFIRDPQWWLIHFVFFYLVLLFSYPVLRIPQSLAMDIFLALKGADLKTALRLLARIEAAVVFLLAAIVLVLCVLFTVQTALFTLRGEVLYQLWIYFLGAIVVRSAYQGYLTLYRSAGTEHLYNTTLAVVLLAIMAPLQIFTLLYLRGNLALVYAIDMVCFLSLAILLRFKNSFAQSPIYYGAIKRALRVEQMLLPQLWLQYLALIRRAGVHSHLLVVQLDQRYRSGVFEQALLSRVAKYLGPQAVATLISPGLFLYLLPRVGTAEAAQLAAGLKSRMGGHLRNIVPLDAESTVDDGLRAVLALLAKAREPTRRSRALILNAQSALASGAVTRSLEQLAKYSFVERVGAVAASIVRELLVEGGFGGHPVVFSDGQQCWVQGAVGAKQRLYAAGVFRLYGGLRSIVPLSRKSYVIFAVFGQPVAVVRCSEDMERRAASLHELAFRFTVAASIKAARECRPAEDIPAPLLELFHSHFTKSANPAARPRSTFFAKALLASVRSVGRVILIILLLVGAFRSSANAQVENSLTVTSIGPEQLVCAEDHINALWLVHDGRRYLIKVPALVSSPIIQGALVCKSFLRSWLGELEMNNAVINLTNIRELPEVQDYTAVSADIESACLRLGFCMEDLFDYLKVREQIRACQPRQSIGSLISRMMPRVLRARYEMISKVSIEISPFTPLMKILKRYAASGRRGSVMGSSMTIGTGTAAQLAEALRGDSAAVLLALDAGVIFATGQGEVLASNFNEHPKIAVIPITSGDEFRSIHHWKMVVSEQGSESTLSSMNLSTPAKTAFTDLAYTFDDPDVAAELRALLGSALKKQCRSLEHYRCLVDFAHSDLAQRQALYTLADNGCQALAAAAVQKPQRARFFMQPQDTDLEHLVRKLVAKAAKEVIIVSHKFTLARVHEALKEAHSRGVRVHVFTSERPALVGSIAPYFRWNAQLEVDRRMAEPHMKLMIVDRKVMFFGTGNFTRNGFYDARELFGVTDDSSAIGKVLSLVASMHRAHTPNRRDDFGLPPTAEQWLVVGDGVREIAGTERAQVGWMSHYRKVLPEARERLRDCGLGQLLFVVEEDYMACMF